MLNLTAKAGDRAQIGTRREQVLKSTGTRLMGVGTGNVYSNEYGIRVSDGYG
jgi:hypothetical protein